jgi:GDP/UDP-N,N'-diacetylbacillosamine 2-epimerase (hydrolysing)
VGFFATMRIGVLTSSRADYGLYKPLLTAINKKVNFKLSLIVFGTHLSSKHGMTKNQIVSDGFPIDFELDTITEGDSPCEIAQCFSHTSQLFADFWNLNGEKFDWILCLGDRYEMAAAVIASIPYQLKFAHLYAGETTKGAFDDIYRHQISLVCKKHFVSLDQYKKRVQELIGDEGDIEIIGNLSLHNLKEIKLLSTHEFEQKWNINLNRPSILVTFHPETINYWQNENYVIVISEVIMHLQNEFQVIITMPNSDTFGSMYREKYEDLLSKSEHIKLIENLGTTSYFSCMSQVDFVLGNSSSGIVEPAAFGKYAINVGERQKGRISLQNVVHVPFDKDKILEAVNDIKGKKFIGQNFFYVDDALDKIITSLS